jgi:SOS response regulatory protein OraA/RecX
VEEQRSHALAVATRALAKRDFSARGLRERLARAGVEPTDADEALAALKHAGLVSDARFARQRAQALAERGKGDAAIRFDLERQRVEAGLAEEAIAALEPERERAARIVARRGAGPKTARLLAGRGFDAELAQQAADGSVAPGP